MNSVDVDYVTSESVKKMITIFFYLEQISKLLTFIRIHTSFCINGFHMEGTDTSIDVSKLPFN